VVANAEVAGPAGSADVVDAAARPRVASDASELDCERSVSVTVPAGFKPGDYLHLEADGVDLVVCVPPDRTVGDTFSVPLPGEDAATPPNATPVALPDAVLATPVRSRDEELAARLQRLELLGHLADLELGDGRGLSEAERVCLAYRVSIRCVAAFHAVLILLYGFLGPWMKFAGLALLAGPAFGYYGASHLVRSYVSAYLFFCVLGAAYAVLVFVQTQLFFVFLFFLISLWYLQIVYKFWRVLGAVSPERRKSIARALYADTERS